MLSKIRSFLFENTSTKQTIMKNTFWLILAEGVNKGSVFVVTILIARILGPEEFGVMSFVTAFVSMFIVLTDFGLTTLMVREVSRDQSRLPEYLVNLSFLKLILGLITFALVAFVSPWIGKPDSYLTLILIYAGYAIVNNLAEFLRAFFRPSEQMQHEAYLKIGNGLIFIAIMGYILLAHGTLESIMYGFLVSGLIGVAVSVLYVGKKFSIQDNLTLRRDTLIHSIKRGAYIGLGAFFITLYISSDQIIMGFYGQMNELGIYSLAYRFTLILGVFTGIIFMTLLPKTSSSSYSKNILENYKRGRKKIFLYNSLLIFLLECILLLAYNLDLGRYQESILILQFLLIYNLIEPLGYWGYINLIAQGKENKNLFIVIIVGLTNVIMNLILIPKYSYIGAIVTTIISYCLYFTIVNLLITGKFPQRK